MKIYFFGDIHGNTDALEVALRQADSLKPDEVICLGDIIGWLPWGRDTLKTIMTLGIPSVAGNHDLMVAGVFTDSPSQIDRMQATAYTAGTLHEDPQSIDYLLSLKLTIEKKDLIILHHSPFELPGENQPISIENFTYLDEEKIKSNLANWQTLPYRTIISGHDHIPMLFELTKEGNIIKHPIKGVFNGKPFIEERFTLRENSKYWVKAGAIGGPYRDGIPCVNSLLYDSESFTISFFRLVYDVKKVSERLRNHRFFRNITTIQKYIRTIHDFSKTLERGSG